MCFIPDSLLEMPIEVDILRKALVFLMNPVKSYDQEMLILKVTSKNVMYTLQNIISHVIFNFSFCYLIDAILMTSV